MLSARIPSRKSDALNNSESKYKAKKDDRVENAKYYKTEHVGGKRI